MRQCEFPKCGRGKSRCMCEGDPVTDKPTDAVAQAREKYERCVLEARFAHEHQGPSELAAAVENLDCAWAEVLAAVRAECAAKVRDMRTIYTNKPYSDFAQGWHEACDAITRALEAKP